MRCARITRPAETSSAAGYNGCLFFLRRDLMFYVIAVLMVLLALAFVLVPILRNRSGDTYHEGPEVSVEAANLAACRLQSYEAKK